MGEPQPFFIFFLSSFSLPSSTYKNENDDSFIILSILRHQLHTLLTPFRIIAYGEKPSNTVAKYIQFSGTLNNLDTLGTQLLHCIDSKLNCFRKTSLLQSFKRIKSYFFSLKIRSLIKIHNDGNTHINSKCSFMIAIGNCISFVLPLMQNMRSILEICK